tara:strand:- start:1454 stop:2134 length:681 start_codon:yes stop_codon:yes gene_type:complete
MKINTLKQIIENKKKKIEFSIITDLSTGETKILKKDLPLDEKLKNYSKQINDLLKSKKNGVISDTNLFVETFVRPIKVIIVGAVHIAQYLIDYAKSLNFEIYIIDPRGYFASEKRFPDINIINKWPDAAFEELETDESTALIALTHDPKIDDPALKYALDKRFYYIGALGSKKTHSNRCNRLKDAGYTNKQIDLIHGPVGIKLGGKSASEIALSIISQLVLITNNR